MKQETARINAHACEIRAIREEMEQQLSPTTPCEDCGGSGIDIGSLSPTNREDCPSCSGSGNEPERRIPNATRVEMYDDIAGQFCAATVIGHHAETGWYEVVLDGVTNDTTSIDPSLIMRVLPAIERKPPTFANLTLDEQLVASIAIVQYRNSRRGGDRG